MKKADDVATHEFADSGFANICEECNLGDDHPIHRVTTIEVCEFDFDGCPGDCPGEIHRQREGGARREEGR